MLRSLHHLMVLGLVCWGVSFSLLGQEPVFHEYTIEQGLPSNETYMVLEDSKGYIWVATDHGVSRFDGYEFETFTTADGLPDNTILGIHEDDKGRVWFFMLSRDLAYFEDGVITPVYLPAKYHHTIYGIPTSLYVDENDTVWVGSKNAGPGGIMSIAPDGQVELMPFNSTTDKTQIKIFEPGKVVFTGPSHEDKIHIYGEELLSIQLKIREGEMPTYTDQLAVFPRKDGTLVMAYRNKLLEYAGGKIAKEIDLPSRNNLGILEDSEGNLWISKTQRGLLFLPAGQWEQPPYNWLRNYRVSHIAEDKNGGIWITTLDEGLLYCSAPHMNLQVQSDQFDHSQFRQVYGQANNLIVGTQENGALHFEIHRDGNRDIRLEKVNEIPDAYNVKNLSPGGFSLISTVENRSVNSFLYSTTKREVVQQLGPAPFRVFKMEDTSAIGLYFNTLTELNFSTGERTIISPKITDRFRCGFWEDSCLWAGSVTGLQQWKFDQSEPITFDSPLLQFRVNSIVRHADRLLVGTKGAGLVIMEPDTVWNITEKEGLLSDLISDLKVDNDGHVWVASNKGVSHITAYQLGQAPELTNYTGTSSLLSNQVSQLCIIDSLVIALSSKGLTIIKPEAKGVNQVPPIMYIRGIKVNNKDTTTSQVLELDHNQNNLSISYTGISMPSNGNVLYKYRLIGADPTWRVTRSRELNYSQLGPGDYEFEVMAKSAAGQWSAVATVAFHIAAPYWSSWWFYTIIVALAIAFGYALFRWRLAQVNNQNQLKLAYLRSEQKALRLQITPHFIFNAINSILGLIASKKNRQAMDGLSRFARLMRMVLDVSESPTVALSEELNTLRLYLDVERLRFDHNFQYALEIHPDLDEDFVQIPPMVVQPYVENAIKHGLNHKLEGSKRVDLEFSMEGDTLLVTVTDNGIGRAAAAKIKESEHILRNGKGMQISKDRLRILSETFNVKMNVEIDDLKDDAGAPQGTRVRIYFPQMD